MIFIIALGIFIFGIGIGIPSYILFPRSISISTDGKRVENNNFYSCNLESGILKIHFNGKEVKNQTISINNKLTGRGSSSLDSIYSIKSPFQYISEESTDSSFFSEIKSFCKINDNESNDKTIKIDQDKEFKIIINLSLTGTVIFKLKKQSNFYQVELREKCGKVADILSPPKYEIKSSTPFIGGGGGGSGGSSGGGGYSGGGSSGGGSGGYSGGGGSGGSGSGSGTSSTSRGSGTGRSRTSRPTVNHSASGTRILPLPHPNLPIGNLGIIGLLKEIPSIRTFLTSFNSVTAAATDTTGTAGSTIDCTFTSHRSIMCALGHLIHNNNPETLPRIALPVGSDILMNEACKNPADCTNLRDQMITFINHNLEIESKKMAPVPASPASTVIPPAPQMDILHYLMRNLPASLLNNNFDSEVRITQKESGNDHIYHQRSPIFTMMNTIIDATFRDLSLQNYISLVNETHARSLIPVTSPTASKTGGKGKGASPVAPMNIATSMEMTLLPNYFIFQNKINDPVITERTIFFSPPRRDSNLIGGSGEPVTIYYDLVYAAIPIPTSDWTVAGMPRHYTSHIRNDSTNVNANLDNLAWRALTNIGQIQGTVPPTAASGGSAGTIPSSLPNGIIAPLYAIYKKRSIPKFDGTNKNLTYPLIPSRGGLTNFGVTCYANSSIQILRHSQPFIQYYSNLPRVGVNCEFHLPYTDNQKVINDIHNGTKRTRIERIIGSNSVQCALRNLILADLTAIPPTGGASVLIDPWFDPGAQNALTATYQAGTGRGGATTKNLMLFYLVQVFQTRAKRSGQCDSDEFMGTLKNFIQEANRTGNPLDFMTFQLDQYLQHNGSRTCTAYKSTGPTVNATMHFVQPNEEGTSVQNGLAASFRIHQVQANCPQCRIPDALMDTWNKLDNLPRMLNINIARFLGGGGKNNRFVKVEEEILILPEYRGGNTVTPSSPPIRYLLYGIVTHIGETLNGGHYVSYIRNQANEWNRFDDQEVTRSSYEQATNRRNSNETPYMLYYMRID